jgi:two-component system OmpR family sensor kinase
MYQVVDLHEHVLLRSAETPVDTFDVPLAAGFANNPTWRIYTVRHPTLGLYFQVADPLDERRRALNRTLFGLIIPLGAVLPLLALVLRNVARTELRVLQQLSGEIEKRSGADLRPITLPGLPQELRTVGDHVNRCWSGCRSRSTWSARWPPMRRTNCARRWPRRACGCRPRWSTTCGATTCRPRSTRCRCSATAPRSCCSCRARNRARRWRARGSTWSSWRAPWRRSSGKTRSSANAWRSRCPTSPRRWRSAMSTRWPSPAQPGGERLRYGGGGRVVIEVMAPCTLAVRDFGAGVNAEQLQTLQQRHVRHSSDRAGYGLGLSIVGTIVEKHDAKLELSSPPAGAAQGFEARIVLQAA